MAECLRCNKKCFGDARLCADVHCDIACVLLCFVVGMYVCIYIYICNKLLLDVVLKICLRVGPDASFWCVLSKEKMSH